MLQSLWTGISGLTTQQQGIDTTSSNIANVNTVAYKSSRVSFADHVYQQGIGKGAYLAGTQKQFQLGNISVTNNPFDIALKGEGFLTVRQPQSDGSSKTYFTRAGNLKMGSDGTLEDASGNKVQGWAMVKLDPDDDASGDLVRTNPSVSKFDQDYSKSLASQLIYKNGEIISINAKSTDYQKTAKADDKATFSGAGRQTLSAKLQNIDLLKNRLQQTLKDYANDPKAPTIPSQTEIGYVDFYASNPKVKMDLKSGDSMNVYINGENITQAFYIDDNHTMRALADKISAQPGLRAYMSEEKLPGNPDPEVNNLQTRGVIIIESVVPGGKPLNLGEVSYTSAGVRSVQSSGTIREGVAGSGQGAIDSARDALMEAVKGKQRSIWGNEDAFPDTYVDAYSRGVDPITIKGSPATVTAGDKLKLSVGNKSVEVELDSANITKSKGVVDANGAPAGANPSALEVNDPGGDFIKPRSFSNAQVAWTGTGPTYAVPGGITATTTTPYYPATLAVEKDIQYTDTYDEIFKNNIKNETREALVKEADDAYTKVYDKELSRLTLENDALPNATKRGSDEVKQDADTLATSAKMQILGIIPVATNGNGLSNGGAIPAPPAIPQYYEEGATPSKDDPVNAAIIRAQEAGYKKAVVLAEKGETVRAHTLALLAEKINDDTKDSETTGLALLISAKVINDRLIVTSNKVGDDVDARIEYYSPTLSAANGGSIADGTVERLRNLDMSVPTGGGADFMQIKTTVNQKASQNDLQLILDTLDISTITGGEFKVRENGLITIKQGSNEFAIGQISVGTFKSIQGLKPSGENLYEATDLSGDIAYTKDNASMARVQQNNLESSNADLSKSLVNLIVFQRAFEASAKSVTTSDSMLKTLIDLKR